MKVTKSSTCCRISNRANTNTIVKPFFGGIEMTVPECFVFVTGVFCMGYI